MSYVEVDPILHRWAKEQRISVLAETQTPCRRYFYVSSPAGETFQIVIEPPRGETVRLDVHLIETWREEEVHDVHETRIEDLQTTFNHIIERIKNWFDRKS
jgi:DNA-binding PadR family transcriptional regulator